MTIGVGDIVCMKGIQGPSMTVTNIDELNHTVDVVYFTKEKVYINSGTYQWKHNPVTLKGLGIKSLNKVARS